MLNHKQIAVAIILIAYISALTFSNQAFAQDQQQPPKQQRDIQPRDGRDIVYTTKVLGEVEMLAGHEGKILGSHPDLR